MFAMLLLVPSIAASAAIAATDPCVTAATLLASGDVKGARATIEAARASGGPGVCAAEATRAGDQVRAAVVLAELAQKAQLATEWSQAATLADDALALDAANAAAKTVKTAAAGQLAAYTARVEAAQKADQSWLEALQADWDAFYYDNLKPLAAVLLPFLLVWLVLFTAARLLVLARESWKPTDGDADLKPWRHLLLASGIVSLAAGALTLTVTFADLEQEPGTQITVWSAGLACLSAGVLTAAVGAGAGLRRRVPSPVLFCFGLAEVGMAFIGLIVHTYHAWNWPAPVDRASVALLGTVTSVGGVWLSAWWLATRLRLSVAVGGADGKDDASQAGAVVALLGELGLEKPRGLEVPSGADVTALSGAFASLPDNVILKHLKSLVVDAAGFTPWTVEVSGTDTSRSVTVRRNGRTIASTVIEVGHLLPTAPAPVAAPKDAVAVKEPDAALRLVAAFVLTTLAGKHDSVKKGLAGAVDWRSVGLQYIATADWVDESHEAQQKQALAKALNLDPGNLAAQLAYRHAQDRKSDDPTVLQRYGTWLDGFVTHCERYPALLLRARYTRTVIAINRAYAVPRDQAAGPLKDAIAAALELRRLLDRLDQDSHGHEELSTLTKQTRAATRPLFLLCEGRDYDEREPPSSPIEMYNLACFFASRHERKWILAPGGPLGQHEILGPRVKRERQRQDDATAVAFLQLAQSDPVDPTWYLDDPQLAKFRTRPAFRKQFLPEPRDDFFEIAHLEPFADKLRAAGYVNPTLLAGANPYHVRDALKSTGAVASLVITAAELHEDLASTEQTRPWAVEIIDQLAAVDVTTLASVQDLSRAERRALAGKIARNLTAKVRDQGEPGADELTDCIHLTRVLRRWLKVR
jgi:hypothetical protein